MLRVVNSARSENHSSSLSRDAPDDDGPTPEDLAAIEDEWPLIEAELDLVGTEIAALTARPHPTELDWRRLRRAETRVGRAVVSLVNRGIPVDLAA